MNHPCGLEVTECDECGTELEVGQVGKCEECTPQVFTFAELSDKAKDKARQDYTGEGYLEHEWWEHIYEDAVRVAEILGIRIGTRDVKLMNGKTRSDPEIYFSGFCSQGDGACFVGYYHNNLYAVDHIKSHCDDKELLALAERLTLMQITSRLQGCPVIEGEITAGGRYSHSNTMNFSLEWDEFGSPDFTSEQAETASKTALQIMRDFADWIYAQLEAENDWLYSDECVDAALADEKFDESGSLI